MNSATRAFLDVLSAQEELAFARQALEMQQDLTEAQSTLVESGKISAAESETGRAVLSFAKIAMANAEAQLDTARSQLGAFWSSPRPHFRRAVGSIHTGSPPPLEGYEDDLAGNPVLAYHAEQIRRHQARVVLEEAQRTPDISIGLGARHFEDSDENAAVFSISIPLPLFDRRQGEIARARAEVGKAEAEQRSAQRHGLGVHESGGMHVFAEPETLWNDHENPGAGSQEKYRQPIRPCPMPTRGATLVA